MSDLEKSADAFYGGHGALLGRWPVSRQDVEYLRVQFGGKPKTAHRRYQDDVTKRAARAGTPPLAGGRFNGVTCGWKEVAGRRRRGRGDRMDDIHMLGHSTFVDSVLAEARQALDR